MFFIQCGSRTSRLSPACCSFTLRELNRHLRVMLGRGRIHVTTGRGGTETRLGLYDCINLDRVRVRIRELVQARLVVRHVDLPTGGGAKRRGGLKARLLLTDGTSKLSAMGVIIGSTTGGGSARACNFARTLGVRTRAGARMCMSLDMCPRMHGRMFIMRWRGPTWAAHTTRDSRCHRPPLQKDLQKDLQSERTCKASEPASRRKCSRVPNFNQISRVDTFDTNTSSVIVSSTWHVGLVVSIMADEKQVVGSNPGVDTQKDFNSFDAFFCMASSPRSRLPNFKSR